MQLTLDTEFIIVNEQSLFIVTDIFFSLDTEFIIMNEHSLLIVTDIFSLDTEDSHCQRAIPVRITSTFSLSSL